MTESNIQLITDFKQNSSALKIPPEIYLRILGKGIAQTQEDVSLLNKALSQDNFDEIKTIAHRIKGDYLNMHIEQISATAKKIEEVVKTTKDKSELVTLFSDLKTFFSQLLGLYNQAITQGKQ